MNTCENCGSRVYALGCVNCDEPAYIAEQERLTAVQYPDSGRDCPSCGRRMSKREGIEQDVCNACLGGDPA